MDDAVLEELEELKKAVIKLSKKVTYLLWMISVLAGFITMMLIRKIIQCI